MPLRLIVGPPNSGRTGRVLEAFVAALDRDPLLVVPTLDDVDRFERELAGSGPVIGATVCTFDRLFGLVGRATDAPAGPALSRTQRRRVAGEAASGAGLRLLAASARRRGFAAALDELIDELQGAMVDPATLRARATEEAGAYELELADLYGRYCEIRDRLGRHDDHSLAAAATTALRTRPEAWAARPVLLYGFDDLTEEQLELVRELWRTSEVTIALPYEDREVLTAARGRLFAQLRDVDGISITELDADPANTDSATLFELERRFGDPPTNGDWVANDGGLALLASAGELAEVETIGAEVARLLHDGVPAGEIAIVLRDPSAAGPLYRRVLGRFDIPVAVQADLAVTRTVTGTGLVALLEAAIGRRRAADLITYLRTPGVATPATVDWFERSIRRGRMRTADEALAAWGDDGRRSLEEIDKLRDAGSGPDLLQEAARQGRWIAEAAVRRKAAIAGEDRALELRAGAEMETALEGLAELDLPHSPEAVIAAVADLRVPMWRGPTEDRVRVISPYRARARRVRRMFVASLQDGDFPRRDTGGPLLSDEGRAALALPPRKKAEIEDRYLFSICLSRPTERLWLSWRSADDEGGAAARSPFVDEVRELISPPPPDDLEERDEAISREAAGRGVAESVFSPAAAPSEDELARAEAALGIETPGVDRSIRERIAVRLASAAAVATDDRLRPGPLSLDPVKERMATIEAFGPSTLEEYAECPYRWFVDHELQPQRIDPEEEALTSGGIAHKVLEKLYAEPPADRRPTPANLGAWLERTRELIEELGPERLPRERVDTAAALRRVEGLVLAFLADEAAADSPLVPEHAEASFGFEGADQPPLRLAGGAVHGQIDRIDLGPGGEALIQDYKSGAKVEGGRGMLEKGKLQLQLYMLAARELWELKLAGGLYRPLGGRSERQPKGLLRKSARDDLAGLNPRPNDHLDDEKFETALSDARAKAEEIIAAVRRGDIGRRPIGGSCPDYCSFQPICRRERGLPEEEPVSEEEDEE